ncbi:polyketide synthase [Durotheca rogersii]|uniref:polyketide synthase n=1 Tax=Durotheca rogersii TaxID=419775 RepID=UPI00221FCBDF|nr:polyketide synthase [Durotheca rogersii]KAI5867520.1 polyketide synthase [Durotheca rogersii]
MHTVEMPSFAGSPAEPTLRQINGNGTLKTTNGFTNGLNGHKATNGHTNGHTNGAHALGQDINGEDPICIVGMDLWDFLVRKRSAQGPVPRERFNIKAFYHPDGSRSGVMDADGGYFLQEDVRQFENSFFGINNLEATYMDPQQRKLLEVVFECFENAGLSMEAVAGADIGVYVGNFTVDYQMMQARDIDYMHRLGATGSGTAIMANRISHVFDLHGPSFVLDTACSSSIYCLHNAVSAIRSGECSGAIVAGANLITSPEQHLGTAKSGVLSPTSTCHTFDASADGYGRGEAVSAVYLKPLSAALRDGDKVWSVIRSTAINANGKTPGITQPSSKLQEEVIRKAYARAGLSFDDTDYIECHGTGTAVGDPIEVGGLTNCFGPRDLPLKIGSVKTNLGHSEAASGLTSLIKVALAFHNAKIPPSYGVTKLNPKLRLWEANMTVATEVTDWPRTLRRASINSFGYGGANAHTILESVESYLKTSPPEQGLQPEEATQDKLIILPVSAASTKSLEVRIKQTTDAIQHSHNHGVKSLAFTLAQRMPRHRIKGFLTAKARTDGSAEFVQSEITEPVDPSFANLPFAFVFTGQGAQYAGMARELLENNESFLQTIRELDDVLQSLPPKTAPKWTLEQTILDSPEVSQINHVTRSQPICTAVQIGLVNLLQGWAITPSATVGHSSGEIAAAYAAGLLTSKEAILAAYFRGFAVGKLQSRGTMVAAGLGPEPAEDLIKEKGLQGQVCVACVNSPQSVTLSGSEEGADIIISELQKNQTFARKLETNGRAYHSHLVKEIGQLYENLLTPYLERSNRVSDVEMVSSVGYDGPRDILLGDRATTARYWRDNLEKSVQFSSALEKLIGDNKYHLVELGPHSALKSPIQQIQTKTKGKQNLLPYSSTLVRGQDADVCLKKFAGRLFQHGYSLDWNNVNELSRQNQIMQHNIPPYPWDYSSGLLWVEMRPSIDLRNRRFARHELLGSLQPAGNGIDWAWRNVLQLGEVPWLSEHKVEAQVVFPAVAYLAMAMEAASQAHGLKDPYTGVYLKPNTTFEFRNVSFGTALVVQDDAGVAGKGTEVHTLLSWRKLSTTTQSEDWCDFAISSWEDGRSVLHCSGSIRVSNPVKLEEVTTVSNTNGFEKLGMKPWYSKLIEEGISFGPNFQALTSLSTDVSHVRTDAIATTNLRVKVGKETDTTYPVHPVTIDGVMQSGVMGGTGGNVRALRVHLPIFMPECRIRCVGESIEEEAFIHSQFTRTGVSTIRINSTLRDARGTPVVDIKNLRLSMYTGKVAPEINTNPQLQRHPTLRVNWKPDIISLSPDVQTQLDRYIDNFILQHQQPDLVERAIVVGALLDLLGHNNPSMRILELGPECQCKRKLWQDILDMGTALPRCRSWSSGDITGDNEVAIEGDVSGPFDGLLISKHSVLEQVWEQAPQQAISLVGDNGTIITRKTKAAISALTSANFTVIEVKGEIILAVRQSGARPLKGKDVLIVSRNPSPVLSSFTDTLSTFLREVASASTVQNISLADISGVEISSKTICISTLEIEREFLATMSQEDMDSLRKITDVVTNLLWLTGANMLSGNPEPNLTLSNGLSRAIMLEQPSLRWSLLDVGDANKLPTLVQAISENLSRTLTTYDHIDDKEFILVDGLLYTSRFGPDLGINALFRRRVKEQEPIEKIPLSTVGLARLAIGRPGVTDTLHLQQVREVPTAPPSGFIEVATQAVSLNAKDIYAMSGQVETREGTAALEFAGVVTAVGPEVGGLLPGDRVVVMAPHRFATIERVPAWAAHKMLPEEDFGVLCTLPVVYTSALYALRDRAHLRAGESVLIHSGAGAFGMAAISLATRIGATVYTTVGSQAKREFLVNELGVDASHIFSSRDKSFAADLKHATHGRGVDVVVNSLVGDLMHASWDCLASFGRFVEIGKRELVDAGKLEMHMFLKNTTFTAFDTMDIFYHEDQFYRDVWISATKEVLEMYRSGQIKPGPIAKFDVADISQAFHHFSKKDRIGKVVVSLESPKSQVPAAPAKYSTVFDPEKVYLLIGCLGGLGRSLSRWMMSRGARNFVFLGRTGSDKPSARELVTRLENSGAHVTVVRGDISNADHVKASVEACEATGKPIGGVVQAAMGLHEALFSRMTNEAWHTGIQPKWKGTWNLHNALEGHDDALDFFLLTSSVSGSVATATESNYCSANGFLDAFARWRRSQGKKAVSIGLGMISEVGYLHENPEIAALLLRKGLQPLDEEEFLQVVDLSLSGPGGEYAAREPNPDLAHVLTGLEPLGLRKLMAQGWDVTSGNMQDSRTSILSAALLAELGDDQSGSAQIGLADAPAWLKAVPAGIVASFASDATAASLFDAVLNIIRKRFSSFILTPLEQIDNSRPLAQFGMDSMIGAEFRTWIWGTFKVDIPFLDLLSNQKSLTNIAETVGAKIGES